MRKTPRTQATGGFSLMELLVVLGLLAVLMGLSAGAFRRTIPRTEIARGEVLDKLRVARLTAVSEQSAATVMLHVPALEDGWTTVSVTAFRQVGMWHLEGDDLRGFPTTVTGSGYSADPEGVVGGALFLSDTAESYLDLGHSGSFESAQGLSCELYVKLDGMTGRMLIQKGEALQLSVDQDGYLSLSVQVQMWDERGQEKKGFQRLETQRPVLVEGRWQKVGASFDGMALQLRVDDAIVEESVLPERISLLPDIGTPVVVGRPGESFSGSVDEVKFGIFRTEVSEPLVDMEPIGEARLVRFAAGGGLDPRFHDREAELGFVAPSGVETWIRVSMLGSVNWE